MSTPDHLEALAFCERSALALLSSPGSVEALQRAIDAGGAPALLELLRAALMLQGIRGNIEGLEK